MLAIEWALLSKGLLALSLGNKMAAQMHKKLRTIVPTDGAKH